MRQNIRLCSLLLTASLLPITASGQSWMIIDDFENGGDDWEIFFQMDDEASIIVGEYPDAGEGNFFYIDSQGDTHTGTPLPMTIQPGETATLYFESYMTGVNNVWIVMLSDMEEVITWANSHFRFRQTFETDPPGGLQQHSGGGYALVSTEPEGDPIYPEIAAWHKWWLVVHVSEDEVNQPSTYEAYWQSPDHDSPVGPLNLLLAEGSQPYGNFSRPVEGAIQTLAVASYTSQPQSPQKTEHRFFLDNFYITEGEHLSDPAVPKTPTTWAGFPVVEDYADTGAGFLGWLYVGSGDGWVSDEELAWIYLPEGNVTDDGAWAYLPRQ